MNRTITVKGMGKVSVAPDLVEITMSLSALDIDYEKAMSLASEQIADVRQALSAIGFDKDALKTTDFNVSPKYDSVRGKNGDYKSVFQGFDVSHRLRLEFDFTMKRLNETLIAISKCSAKPKFDVSFTVKDKNAVSEQLLRDAVNNAAQKAKILASAAGVKLGEIIDINYSWGEINVRSVTTYELRCETIGAAPDFDISPDDIDVSDTVTVVWAIA